MPWSLHKKKHGFTDEVVASKAIGGAFPGYAFMSELQGSQSKIGVLSCSQELPLPIIEYGIIEQTHVLITYST